jgi:ATP-dependent helicase IRC3
VPLRKRQVEALDASLEKWKQGVHRQLIQLPTGGGKTVVAANMPTHHGIDGRILFMVHREELVDQTVRAFQKWNPGWQVGVEMAQRYSTPSDRVVVASVPTIGRSESKRLDRLCTEGEPFELVQCDEAHHAVADSYKNVFRRLGLLPEPGREDLRRLGNGTGTDTRRYPLLVGITATPNRGDGKAMAEVFDEIVYQFSMRDAIQEGWLVDLMGYKVRTDTNLTKVKITAGDYNLSALANAINTPQRNAMVVKAWIDHAWPRQTIGFAADVQHAKDLARAFQQNSIPAEAIWADDPQRADKLRKHRNKELNVLMNCGILTEGYDDWRVEAIIMARPTSSQLLFVQMVGRGARLPEGIDNLIEASQQGIVLLKKDCLVLDVVDVTRRNSLVTLSSIFGMNAEMDLKGKSVVKTIRRMEQLEQENPHTDFSQVVNVNDLETIVEKVDLFEFKLSDEIKQASTMSWHKALDGSYVLHLFNNEKITVIQDLLGKYTTHGVVKGFTFVEHGFDNLQAAIQFADMKLSTYGREYIAAMKKHVAGWSKFIHTNAGAAKDVTKSAKGFGEDHHEPATTQQRSMLQRFYGAQRAFPAALTKGEAQKLISEHIKKSMRA